MAIAVTRTEVSYEDQLADILETETNPETRARKLAALYALVEQDLLAKIKLAEGKAILDLAEQLGPRDFGPRHDRRYNFGAAARKLGISNIWAKELAGRARATGQPAGR